MQTLGTPGDLQTQMRCQARWKAAQVGVNGQEEVDKREKNRMQQKERGEETGFECSYIEMRCWLLGVDKSAECQRIMGLVCVHSR